ncbi:MAG: formamidopyrimidine-DNA glycosylase [Deltaproteobacteria bacterium]|nr:formamidopyrimidine-DNA glycosylase [Deltaproteobacteria bacterium]
MPELPEIDAYLCALRPRLLGRRLVALRLGSPFVLRSVRDLADLPGRTFVGVRRLGKRVVLELSGGTFLVVHLMLAGRLQWQKPGAAVAGKGRLLAIDLDDGSLVLTEAGKERRASLHVVDGEPALAELDAGGLELLELQGEAGAAAFAERLRAAPGRTLKRALSEPWRVAGVGGAFADEICWEAEISPFARAQTLDDARLAALLAVCQRVLRTWRDRLCAEAEQRWPAKVTAFRPEMAVHGKHREPCPRCGAAIQRVVARGRETNYCPPCQTGGRVLADRMLSQLLKDDWRGDPLRPPSPESEA